MAEQELQDENRRLRNTITNSMAILYDDRLQPETAIGLALNLLEQWEEPKEKARATVAVRRSETQEKN